MLKSLLPRTNGEMDETKFRRLSSIRQLARAFRNHPLPYHEAVLTADELMDMLTARDAQIAAMDQEIKRLNSIVNSCQRDIQEMRKLMEQFEIRLPEKD